MATKKIEVIIGEVPTGPVDKAKAQKSQPAILPTEAQVEAYGARYGSPPTECPKCGALNKMPGPTSDRSMIICWNCDFTFAAHP
jgi:hypothetical protein